MVKAFEDVMGITSNRSAPGSTENAIILVEIYNSKRLMDRKVDCEWVVLFPRYGGRMNEKGKGNGIRFLCCFEQRHVELAFIIDLVCLEPAMLPILWGKPLFCSEQRQIQDQNTLFYAHTRRPSM